jgi:hypothetical protein
VHLRFVPTGLSGLQLGERIVQALEPSIDLAGSRFCFGRSCFGSGQEVKLTVGCLLGALFEAGGRRWARRGSGRLIYCNA